MAQFFAPLINNQQEDANGNPLSGGTIEVYLAGTSTPATTTSDKAGLVPNTWPIVLNTLGVNNQGAVWITGGATYKYVIKNAAGVVQRTIDNVSGINDTTVSIDQWIVYQGTPTYVSATSFTVVGDQTQTFQVGRRFRATNTGGLVYGSIASSSYVAPNTVVTVVNDSGVLDSGLSAVAYGILSVLTTSAPYSPYVAWASTSVTLAPSAGAFSNATAVLRYKVIGKTTYFSVVVTIIANGTGSGSIQVTLPLTAAAETGFAGRESQTAGWGVVATMAAGSPILNIVKYDGTYPGANNHRIAVSGVVEAS